ncbi:SGNH/GDSL hydrolase family protein [Bacillus sp. FJAT-27245]|uniref:SGNH/GDSL hydrolase family protein n=1 Tax=Bacillus sp. FJAT-27245 TaxID=1684144 RepID=UPI0006A78AB7|nr:SGNH/GDSL hydrolase family protein [Bacillus sp. FJAT-27245]
MKRFVFLFIFLSLAVVLGFGSNYYHKKIEAKGKESYIAYKEKLQQEEAEKKKETLAKLDRLNPKSNNNQPVIDFLHYNTLMKERVAISVIGSSVAKGEGASTDSKAWPRVVESRIRGVNEDLRKITVKNHGESDLTTQDIVDHGIVSAVVKDYPALVLIETSLLHNHGKSLSMDGTKTNLTQIVSSLKEALPNARIVLFSAYPSPEKIREANARGYRYGDYLRNVEDLIEENGWDYFDMNKGIQTYLAEKNVKFEDTLKEDGVHPNDEGQKIWAEVLFGYLSK